MLVYSQFWLLMDSVFEDSLFMNSPTHWKLFVTPKPVPATGFWSFLCMYTAAKYVGHYPSWGWTYKALLSYFSSHTLNKCPFHAHEFSATFFFFFFNKLHVNIFCWWECKLVQPLWKTVWRFLKKLEIELPYDPTIHFWAYTPRKPDLKETRAPQCSSPHCLS